MMTFIPKLVQNLLEILEDNEYYDVIIEVETFQIILRYIYAGNLSLIEYDTLNIIKILVAASELGLQELITNIQSFLIKNKVSWIKQNFNLVYQTCFENDSFSELQNFCTDLITRKPENVFRSIDFNSISEKCLISLIQRDNIQIDDIKVWEHVLKWGIAQNPELPSDLSNYSKDDINILSNTLQRCIPFIKFYNLTSEEFLNKVHPYEKILPKELRKNLDMYNINNYVLSRVADEKKAIFGSIDFGPTFGSDLTIFGERYYGLSHCDSRFYEKRIRETSYYFSVWEYEIFQIIKN
ncbi:BTB/POZ protein [Rhizophagus clarus]|uniref:BTB/POZ protein n=1 Tax=Rhizophagus clarus TaxID=94130 RepID=A0A8H3R4K1_9GLOM|nr:BTB/POZ protein [Rhizophagus clarus]